MKTANRLLAMMAMVMLAFSFGCEPTTAQTNKTTSSGDQDVQAQEKASSESEKSAAAKTTNKGTQKLETATFGAGCFWCVEAVFQELNGVSSVKSGYTGGQVKDPTYEEICTGRTGHAEVCRIEYDPAKVSFKELLEVFWQTHDPTTLNQQGADVGTQYRSAVFYHNEAQKADAENYKKKLDASGAFRAPIVTEITAASKFYPAENYHDNYFINNPNAGYCRAVIKPKMDKFRKVFEDKLKSKK